MPRTNEDYIPNTQLEQSVMSANNYSEYSDNKHLNDDKGNALYSNISDTSTTQTVSTEVSSNTKQKIKLPPNFKGSDALLIYHQNVCGLRGKADELLGQLHPTLPHVLCFSEHHMKQLQLQTINIDNYKLGDNYCRNRYEMGGVCIYVHVKLNYTSLNLRKYCQDKDFEVCAIKVNLNDTNICIIAIYRAPSGDFELFISKLDTVLRKVYTTTTKCIICGDINIDYLIDSEKKNRLNALLQTYNLTSIIKFPTRIYKSSATAIDNFFIDTQKMETYSISPLANGLSDHDAQLLMLHSCNIRPPSNKFTLIRQINDYTMNDFLNKLSYETWDTVFSTDDVNIMFNSFLDTYLKLYYASFPLKRIHTNKKYKNWITSAILTSCRHKRELFVACRSNMNPHLLNYYKNYCKILSAVIREAKKITYADKIEKASNKNKEIWHIVQQETNKTKTAEKINTLNVNGVPIRNCEKKANAFNAYFTTIATNINAKHTNFNQYIVDNNNNTPLHYLIQSYKIPFPDINLKSVSTNEIENIIKSLKQKNSSGYDEISSKLLKFSSPFIVSPLTHICNRSISTGIFPDRLKYAVVTPLFKKGEKTTVSNYRPISILSSFSKILERVMYKQLQDHLEKYSILAQEQFGFRSNSTTNKAIYKLTNEILNALNNKLIVGGIFFDLEKAFDCLNHDTLLAKLQFYGINGKSLSWFRSYLNNRYMRVQIKDENSNQISYSNWGKITNGVPQGSILGPLLFLVYINDLPNIINNTTTPILFADDTSIIVKNSNFKDFQTNMAVAFETINTWFKVNSLTINVEKTHYIQFRAGNTPSYDINIDCDNNLITSVDNIKFLGIHLQDSIKWNCHIEHILPKLSSACYIMRNIRQIMPINTLKTVYYSYFNAIITYGLPFWGNSPHSTKIFIMQKRIIRIMTGTKNRVSCRNLFKKLGILPLASLYIFYLMLFVVQNKHLFILNSDNYTRSTRQVNNLYYPTASLTLYQHGVYYMGVRIYNSLPLHIKDMSGNIKRFERSLKQFLHIHSFYSLEEYFQYN